MTARTRLAYWCANAFFCSGESGRPASEPVKRRSWFTSALEHRRVDHFGLQSPYLARPPVPTRNTYDALLHLRKHAHRRQRAHALSARARGAARRALVRGRVGGIARRAAHVTELTRTRSKCKWRATWKKLWKSMLPAGQRELRLVDAHPLRSAGRYLAHSGGQGCRPAVAAEQR